MITATTCRIPVYALLENVGELVPHPVDVVLERDGAFPAFSELLESTRSRARRPARGPRAPGAGMSPRD